MLFNGTFYGGQMAFIAHPNPTLRPIDMHGEGSSIFLGYFQNFTMGTWISGEPTPVIRVRGKMCRCLGLDSCDPSCGNSDHYEYTEGVSLRATSGNSFWDTDLIFQDPRPGEGLEGIFPLFY